MKTDKVKYKEASHLKKQFNNNVFGYLRKKVANGFHLSKTRITDGFNVAFFNV